MFLVSRMSNNGRDEPAGIGGWLLLLSRLLIVWQPLNLAVAGMGALGAIGVRGPAVAAVLVVRMIVTGVGIAAGLVFLHLLSGDALVFFMGTVIGYLFALFARQPTTMT